MINSFKQNEPRNNNDLYTLIGTLSMQKGQSHTQIDE